MSKRPVVERMIGGAGTGKTHAVLSAMNRAREELRLEPEEIAFSTYTRNGREVMARRAAEEWGCSEQRLTTHGQFRTTHSMALRQTGIKKDQLLTGGKKSAEWMSEAIGTELATEQDEDGNFAVTAPSRDSSEAAFAINAWNLARSRLDPFDDVMDEAHERGENAPSTATAKAIVERYEIAKRADDRVDFPDLLGRFAGIGFDVEGFSRRTPEGDLPAGMRMLCIDEAQDASALVDTVCRRLASAPGMERVLLVGDPGQSIFSFSGGSAQNFLAWDAQETVMPKSFRCAPPILALGEDCLRNMRHGYWDRGIAPASHDGSIEQAGTKLDAVSSLDPATSTLILARCGFTLKDYRQELSRRSIPFATLGKDDGRERRRGFLALWRLSGGQAVLNADLAAAIEMIRVSAYGSGRLLDEGIKAAWQRGDFVDWDIVSHDEVEEIGFTRQLTQILATGNWLEAILPGFQSQAESWIDSARRYGHELATEPKVLLSTIHSAKGAEADTVIISTESAGRIAQNSACFDAHHDEECRVAYVGVTRARERLVIVEDAGPNRIEMPYDY